MPPPSAVPIPKRPTYLVVALLVAWLIGVGGMMGGCGLVQFYQNPTSSAVQVHEPQETNDWSQYLAKQRMVTKHASDEALVKYQTRMLPLGIANALLSAVLIIAVARAFAGRVGSRPLVLQAVIANAVYAIVDYVLSAPVRQTMIDAAVAVPMTVPMTELTTDPKAVSINPAQLGSAMSWTVQLFFVLQLCVWVSIAFALTRPRVHAYYRAIEVRAQRERL